MNDRTDAVLAAIDGALMDPEIPDGMRWSPEPETVKDPQAMPYDGEVVPIPPQRYERHSDAEGSRPGVSRRLPPDGSMLLAQLRAEHVRLRAERQRLIAQGVPPEALTPPVSPLTPAVQFRQPGGQWENAELGPDGWRPRQPENQCGPDHRPRVTASPRPGLAPGLLIVDELGPGHVSVRRATDAEAADLLRDAWGRFIDGFTPLIQQVGEAFRRFGDALRDAGWAPTGPPTTPEARRALGLPPLSPADARTAALEARRNRPTGPALVGPERRPGPRRGPSPATTPRGRQRPRQGRER